MFKIKLNYLPVFLILLILTGCNEIRPSNQDITTSQITNERALSNLNLGIAYLKERAYEKALDKLNKAKEADPQYSPIYNVFGLLYQQLGDFERAESNFKKALSLNANDSSTMNNYGSFLCGQQRIDDAEAIFVKAASNPLYETPEIAITNAGLCLYNEGRIDEAENYFRRALELNPRVSPALIKMCEISFNEPNYLSARAYLQRYQQSARHTPKSLWLGIQIENELGDKDAVSSYALLLKNSFPASKEATMLKASGIQ